MLDPKQQAFLDAIIENPADETRRLIYADWLEEQGNPRGEFIRIQCQLFNNGEYHPDNGALLEREFELLEEFEQQWLDELGVDVGREREFERGFVNHFEVKASDFLAHGDRLLRATPLEWVRLPYLKNRVQKLANAGLLQALSGFDFSGLKLPAAEFALLINSLSSVKRLRLERIKGGVNQTHAKLLANSPFAGQLEELSLEDTRTEPEFFKFLGKGKLGALKSLAFGSEMNVRPAHFEKRPFPALESLAVRGRCNVAATEEFCHLPNLKNIRFAWAGLPARGFSKMIDAGFFAQATNIELNRVNLTDRMLIALANSDLSNCRRLVIMYNDRVTHTGWDALANCPSLKNLNRLILGISETSELQEKFEHFPLYHWNDD